MPRRCETETYSEADAEGRVVYKALKRIFKVNLGASLVVSTRLDRKFAREIDGKLPEKQFKTPPNTSLMPPPNTRKLLINHPGKKQSHPKRNVNLSLKGNVRFRAVLFKC